MKKLALAVLALSLSSAAFARGGRHHGPDLSLVPPSQLIELLAGSPDESYRSAAAAQLGAWDLRHEDAVRSALLEAFRHDADESVRRTAMHALSRREDATIPPMLIKFLGDKAQPMGLREDAAWILGDIGGKKSIQPLIRALDEHELRFSACRSLGELKAAAAVQRLSEVLLEDADRPVKAEAAEALGKIGDRRALPALIATLGDEDLWNRRDAAHAIGLMPEPKTVRPVLSALLAHDESSDVRMEAVFGLAHIGDAASIKALRAAYDNDPAYRVRSAASDSLTRLMAPGGPFNAFRDIEERIKNGTWDSPGAPKH